MEQGGDAIRTGEILGGMVCSSQRGKIEARRRALVVVEGKEIEEDEVEDDIDAQHGIPHFGSVES